MKKALLTVFTIAALVSAAVPAQQTDMKSMDAKSTDMGKSAAGTTHHAKGTVKAVNPSGGTVTLANGAVKSLNWPAMTMGFRVKDKALFDKLTVGRKVAVSFVKEGANFVVTSVK